MSPSESRPLRFVFLSSNRTPWGGSEELWSAAAAELAAAGHALTVYKARIDPRTPRVQRLHALGVRTHDFVWIPWVPLLLTKVLVRYADPLMVFQQVARLWLGLRRFRPDLVVLSQGGNHDGHLMGAILRRMKLPYVVISQKASDFYWPEDRRLPRLRAMYAEAAAAYFVSEHNLRLTEEQLATSLPRASVVRNPVLVPWEPRNDWPDENDGLRLACVGRLFPAEKGQDLLIRVLAGDKWRSRKLSLTFYGEGPQREGLASMAAFLGLTNVTFAGFTGDVSSIWTNHHALFLGSRSEGLPLVVVEAMLSGRVPIVTAVAGAEVIHDDVHGFIASAPTEDALNEALERAWQRRGEWRAIGAAASAHIRTLVPSNPAAHLAETLVRVAEGAGERRVETSTRIREAARES
jgi:glycosyltransferase involved in cell wall biosynthesis